MSIPESELAPASHRDQEAARSAEGVRQEASLTHVGQRHINLMWETTQQRIALWVMATFLVDCLVIVVGQLMGRSVEMPPSLAGVVGYVVGSYFARTNHEKTGGVGAKPEAQGYVGR